MTARRGPALVLGAAIVLGLAAVIASGGLGETHHAAENALPPAALMLGAPAGPGVALGGHPIGLSIEYPLLARDLGRGRCPPAALAHTLQSLGSPTIRIGGDSQDAAAPAGTPAHPGVTDLPSGFWSRLACLEREIRVPIVVGLNLASGEPAWGAELAASARAAVAPALLSFELGNEPDIYGHPVPWWNGRTLVTSAMPWSTYLARARAVDALLGSSSVVEGPDFASGRWIRHVPTLVSTFRLGTLDAHFYPLDACRRHPATATIGALLSRTLQAKIDERVRLVRDARAAGLPAVISEANSVSCGGVAGISDQPASAVWAVRMILRALRVGFSSVRFHASGSVYDPFIVNGAIVTERPLDLGLRFAARVLRPGAVLQPIPDARALDGVAITRPGGERTVLLSNYTALPRSITLAAPARVSVIELRAGARTVHSTAATALHGRARVELAPNSVAAIAIRAS